MIHTQYDTTDTLIRFVRPFIIYPKSDWMIDLLEK